ncbi:MaoC family dehydratase [Pseudorhodoplanes sp.]|uniref:MaoC family dehydratase n=1 Tax=Pseudorhodoplanes sp. TaxID=1934341 RepID=UPI003D0FA708
MKNAADIWAFDDFRPGSKFEEVSISLDAERIAGWTAIYGHPQVSDRIPSGMLVAAMMEAYLTAIQPRPPGNIHASQKLSFSNAAKPGDQLGAEVSCVEKTLHKERRWITFGVTLRNRSLIILRGEIHTIWSR